MHDVLHAAMTVIAVLIAGRLVVEALFFFGLMLILLWILISASRR